MWNLKSEWDQWSVRPGRELLAGAVATFALIPEVIAFSFSAGVQPEVGLYASFILSVVIAFLGGRPAMVTAAAGSVALVAAPLVASHGVLYLFAACILAGVMQIVCGLLRMDVFLRFISHPVRVGFLNALAILIFCAQIPHVKHANLATWGMLLLGVALIYAIPHIPSKLSRVIPSPLLCVLVITIIYKIFNLPLETIADLGKLPEHFPQFIGFPAIPHTLASVQIIFLPAIAIAFVGMLESVMTATVVDNLTHSGSNKSRECTALGIANIAAGLFGGIAGCGMIGQSVGNVRYGGKGRVSTLFAGVFLLILLLSLRKWVLQVPVVSLVAVMVMVSISTFDWRSVKTLINHPISSTAVMLSTVVCTIFSHDLALGVAVGVVMSGMFFARKMKDAFVLHVAKHAHNITIDIRGHLFFASADAFLQSVRENTLSQTETIIIDVSRVRIWDETAAYAFEEMVIRCARYCTQIHVRGLQSQDRHLLQKVCPDALHKLQDKH